MHQVYYSNCQEAQLAMPCHTHLRDNPTNLEWKHKLEIAGVLEQRVPEGILQKVNHIKNSSYGASQIPNTSSRHMLEFFC